MWQWQTSNKAWTPIRFVVYLGWVCCWLKESFFKCITFILSIMYLNMDKNSLSRWILHYTSDSSQRCLCLQLNVDVLPPLELSANDELKKGLAVGDVTTPSYLVQELSNSRPSCYLTSSAHIQSDLGNIIFWFIELASPWKPVEEMTGRYSTHKKGTGSTLVVWTTNAKPIGCTYIDIKRCQNNVPDSSNCSNQFLPLHMSKMNILLVSVNCWNASFTINI